ncbi:hypothetical protein Cni_G17293 [Canna indica]|uniref:Uncharacterized protein n=1 Tax=Canna indica TaxID=4628 RepID=A0AAQ3KJ13_9LILI|nr:hypothetical protein Cni_G17293 [Canna indica]
MSHLTGAAQVEVEFLYSERSCWRLVFDLFSEEFVYEEIRFAQVPTHTNLLKCQFGVLFFDLEMETMIMRVFGKYMIKFQEELGEADGLSLLSNVPRKVSGSNVSVSDALASSVSLPTNVFNSISLPSSVPLDFASALGSNGLKEPACGLWVQICYRRPRRRPSEDFRGTNVVPDERPVDELSDQGLDVSDRTNPDRRQIEHSGSIAIALSVSDQRYQSTCLLSNADPLKPNPFRGGFKPSTGANPSSIPSSSMTMPTSCPLSLSAPSSVFDVAPMEAELPSVTSPPSSRSFERMAEELAVVFLVAPLAPYLPKCRIPVPRKALS